MTVMEFVAGLVNSLAWPVSSVVIACVFRKPIVRFIDRIQLKRIATKGVEAEFDQRLSEVGQAIAIEASAPTPTEIVDAPEDRLSVPTQEDLIEFAPVGAIVAAWGEVESTLDKALNESGIKQPSGRRKSASQVAALLLKHGVLTQSTKSNVEGLAHLRNLAVHGSRDDALLTPDRAKEFAQYAGMLEWSIQHDLQRYLERRQGNA